MMADENSEKEIKVVVAEESVTVTIGYHRHGHKVSPQYPHFLPPNVAYGGTKNGSNLSGPALPKGSDYEYYLQFSTADGTNADYPISITAYEYSHVPSGTNLVPGIGSITVTIPAGMSVSDIKQITFPTSSDLIVLLIITTLHDGSMYTSEISIYPSY